MESVEEMVKAWGELVGEVAGYYGLEADVVLAIIWMESRGNEKAVNERSGAAGLMQVMPAEAGKVFAGRPSGEELLDARVNVEWGCRILKYFLRLEGGSLWRALYRYSGGAYWESEADYGKRYYSKFVTVRAEAQRVLFSGMVSGWVAEPSAEPSADG